MLLAGVVCGGLFAQPQLYTQKAELAVPFGVAAGRLVAVGQYLVFIDEEKPEASLAIAREDIRDFNLTGETLTVTTQKPVRDRSGERTQLSFRVPAGTEPAQLNSWYRSVPPAAAPPKAAAAGDESRNARTYEAKHDHRFGNCGGRLIVEPNRVVFESITDIDHSRQWELRDIKELKRDNPYGIKLIPFAGDTYNIRLLGEGMTNEDHRALVDRITAARVK